MYLLNLKIIIKTYKKLLVMQNNQKQVIALKIDFHA